MNVAMPRAGRNVIVIVADQLRRQSLGIYGDPNVSTPHIDALATQGAHFLAASSTYPVCVPFRFTLMTGEFAHTRDVPTIGWRMSPAEHTLADEFNSAGYDTAYFGKWHLLGGAGVLPGRDARRGRDEPIPRAYRGRWQHFVGFELSNDPYETNYFVDDDPTPYRIDGYQTDGIFSLALDYLDARADADAPFCCVISVEPPHPPHDVPGEAAERWRTRDIQFRGNVPVDGNDGGLVNRHRGYYAAIECLDDNIGRLRDALATRGLDDSTTVIIVADHGAMLGSHGLEGKCDPREESIGIPLIVSGPDCVAGPGIELPVGSEDLFPTILGVAGLTAPDGLPGRDLSPLTRAEPHEIDREGVLLELVAEFRPESRYHRETWRGVRTRHALYAVIGDDGGTRPWLHFDLKADALQMNNLIESPNEQVQNTAAELHEMLTRMLRDSGDTFPISPR